MKSEANTKSRSKFFINGQWVTPAGTGTINVINPCNEEVITTVAMGNQEDVNRAAAAAKAAFPSWSRTTVEERVTLMNKIVDAMMERQNEIGDTVSVEMGMPVSLSRMIQGGLSIATFGSFIPIVESYPFEHAIGRTQIVREPVGVCGFITPWNFPLFQIVIKVAPAIAAGCTMIVKPSQLAPLDAFILAEIMEEAGLPPGVFNLIMGSGSVVGQAIASHPDIDMVSLTGSTSSGILVAQAAAQTIKRVNLELGGKSANILLKDADFTTAVPNGVSENCFLNSGQVCTAWSRMLVPVEKQNEVISLAKEVAESMIVGDAFDDEVNLGPVVDHKQHQSVRNYIEMGIREGATLVTGGPEQPKHLKKGYYIKPTIFANVKPDMTIAKEEIFGPVLSIIPYRNESEAIEIANDCIYGLSGGVWSTDLEKAKAVAKQIRTGQVSINGSDYDMDAPAGGYKQSGYGREGSKYGLEEYLQIKAIWGYNP